jgi:hypothetical protein
VSYESYDDYSRVAAYTAVVPIAISVCRGGSFYSVKMPVERGFGSKGGFSCNALVTGLHVRDQLGLLNEENARLDALQACHHLLA